MARAIPQTTAIDAIARKVVVSLDHHGLVALCDNRPLPDCPDPRAAGGAGSNCTLRCIYDAHAGNNRRSFVRISVTAITLLVRLIEAASSNEFAAVLASATAPVSTRNPKLVRSRKPGRAVLRLPCLWP